MFLDPNKVINQLDLGVSMIAADFGAGSGGWVIPLAKKLKEGRIFAIDIQKEPLSALSGRAKLDRIFNIQTVAADVAKPKSLTLGDSGVDLVLMTNLLFQLDDKEKTNTLKEAKRILKQGGKLLVVDWLQSSGMGPSEGRVSKDDVRKIAEQEGFNFEKELEAGDTHFAMLFTKA